MKITAKTDIGCVYEDNQDYYVAGRLSDDTYWVALCDGMGGVSEGGRASKMAGEFLKAEIEARLTDIIAPETVKGFMLDAVR
ncbi:MAG: serine/threonine-protein phosphatase, partial [Ruminococcaceae bacterium]|nr:serine/threonine-protein phosphatase [Oscillospiraceae bacterium]